MSTEIHMKDSVRFERALRTIFLLLCTACLGGPAIPSPSAQHETITGQIVAYSSSLTCMNGNAVWSMVIRVEKSKAGSSQFVRVDFSLACDKSPGWIFKRSTIQKFRLVRKRDCDAALAGAMRGGPEEKLELPLWEHPPGAEGISIPFGNVLPCYRADDLPLLPMV